MQGCSRALKNSCVLVSAAIIAGFVAGAARAELVEPAIPAEQVVPPVKVRAPAVPSARPVPHRIVTHHAAVPVRVAMATTPKLANVCATFQCGRYMIVGIGF
jgi:hypothetical protein